MHLDPASRTVVRRALVWGIAIVAAVACSAGALASAGTATPLKLGGTWSGSYSGTYTGTFTLHWTQTRSKLKGTITLSSPHGTYGISGSVSGTAITFGAVGVGALYTGSVAASGLAMSGHWTSGPGGGSWKAHRLLTPKKVTLP